MSEGRPSPSEANKKRKLARRGAGFSDPELYCLMDILDEHLPLCREEWDQVVREQEQRYPGKERTVDSLRRKFAKLARKQMPTGDPLMPPLVKRAKQIRYRMTERAELDDADNEPINFPDVGNVEYD